MQKLTFEQYSKLSHAAQCAYCSDLAWHDLARRYKTGKPIVNPTVSGLFKSVREVPALRVKQWEIIERLCWADVAEVLRGCAS